MKVKFKIDYKKDVETFFAFLGDKYNAKRVMNWAIYSVFPHLKKVQITKDDKQFVNQFVLSQYESNSKEMKVNMTLYERQWTVLTPDFHNLIKEIFGNRKWPKGKYVAYSTIWGMYPRFLEDKTFQIPFKYPRSKYINCIIAHELLHFMFYDYCFTKYPKLKSDSKSLMMWHASEIFNVLVQNSLKWRKVFGLPTMEYPEHRKAISKLRKSFSSITSDNLDTVTTLILKEASRI